MLRGSLDHSDVPRPHTKSGPTNKEWMGSIATHLVSVFLIYGPILTIALDDFIDFSWILTLQLSLKEDKEQVEG